ncbi:polar amino acid ABC transporter, inner membrane subunit [Xylanimonas cellulosilytica DSM 15894]|uniref:Polar amino acid ABC transporter, inner membrane subunit n=1 Tax=Xylanimonas cellulosilytica (strain DSM 15894 / JCM 12276 / CECT 5975 / KCTC 9989 / LMG 20990 / NBRC 107835 / XIL07) TaxID=446471 RepID=D1C086_XYLCX|nr:amino acid ABC transporter permease [Xylanimonas cellulosilytica]ACZ30275.1 polar amino acid ABC transporter, inner membrane subunit [Xylanimonas cellulosilytica DSM 15894]
MSASVLFDEPGPRGRRLMVGGNIVGGIFVVGVAAWALIILAQRGQLDAGLWRTATDARAWEFYYLPGLRNTLQAAAVATVGAVLFGVLFGMGRLSHLRAVRWISSVVVEFFRAVPVLLMMVFLNVFFGVVLRGLVPDSAYAAVVVALVLYNGAVIAELVRSGVVNLPRGQSEAGLSLGLTQGQTLRSIQLPQALIAMLPAVISQLVVVLKDSALGQLIGYTDLLRSAQVLASGGGNPLQTLFVVAVLFILVNMGLSWVAHRLSRRLSSRTAGRTEAGPGIGPSIAVTRGVAAEV